MKVPANTSLSTAAASGTVSLAIVVVLQWLLALQGLQIPADVATALGTLITAIVHWIVTKEDPTPTAQKGE
jgi:hypothetical protein